MSIVKIRDVKLEDAARLAEIYSYYVKNTAVSFEYDAPDADEFSGRISSIIRAFPYICITEDDRIVGYAYASKFHPRAAYSHCAELSIYIDKDCRKSGYGRMLYEELEGRLIKQGILNLYACIGVPEKEDEYLTFNSQHFHEHMGYNVCGHFTRCGRKFDRWYNMIWMEKLVK
ncbi:GNAT family N-acetyltransferase [Treponema sp.]|uniref:GNAT family N-acetyltransferase n=1 Tax=Treponema sp. TaxID=166 RepID=UPI0025EC3D62|nr:GNAT family N-acetyltransferase [Treponema sp.]MCR5217908.1 GNAT family N-acetyltransferase [Treponema sp.]